MAKKKKSILPEDEIVMNKIFYLRYCIDLIEKMFVLDIRTT